MIITDKRLSAAALLIEKCHTFADIGSDHAYLPVKLLNENQISHAVITDVNEGPLKNSMKTAQKFSLTEKCEFLLGDGLNPLIDVNFNAISICGMGGELIAKILSDNIEVARKADFLVLQPMSAKDILARYLYENDFLITDESMVKDGHLFYRIIKAVPLVNWDRVRNNQDRVSVSVSGLDRVKISDPFDFEFSPLLIERRDTVMKEYLEFKLQNEKKILSGILAAGSERGIEHSEAMIAAAEKRLLNYETENTDEIK